MAESSGKGDQGIDLNTLSLQQLGSVKEGIENDLQSLGDSFQSLQGAATRFHVSGMAAEKLSQQEEGQPMLVPLTSSLYVAGELAGTDTVLIDIGTGYFVEKTPKEGSEFCKRKVSMLKHNIEQLQQVITEKRQQVSQVSRVLQAKMAAQQGGGSSDK
ncbi:hypothetical protein CYMTET_41492 [Cymbomonas tetramitiformis]|uniref:Prefoldin subunit 5 n=1 Tax=Cymbomonas tetramitiformis TaxID=36881 RepID=A0AAE0C7Y4_9CHLO|nr:hypothetical protein CYMTET_41492 [Cymbomonas tetramitiformis]|eukprot:gene22407-27035_t